MLGGVVVALWTDRLLGRRPRASAAKGLPAALPQPH
jgi:hypothetical protein